MEPWYRDWDCFVYVHELADAEGVNMATGWVGGIDTGIDCLFVYLMNSLRLNASKRPPMDRWMDGPKEGWMGKWQGTTVECPFVCIYCYV